MKRISAYISAAVGVALLATSCSKDAMFSASEAGEGCLRMTVAIDNTTRAYEPLETSTLRIYNSSNGLIRKYSPVSDMPDNLYLVAGNYKVTVEAGDQSNATWTNKSYYGEQTFTITPKQTSSTEVLCKLTNSAVRVVYDASVAEKLAEGYVTYVSTRDEFSKEEAEAGSVPTLKYEANETRNGFFLLPKGVAKISWGFFGATAGEGKAVELTSTMNGGEITPEAGKLYTLRFKFTDAPSGSLDLKVFVDEDDIDDYNDSFRFSPEPTISGAGIGSVAAYNGGDLQFTIAAMNALKTVTVAGKTVLADGMAITIDGIAYTAVDDLNGIVTLSSAYLDTLEAGVRSIEISVTDASDGSGSAAAQVAIPGLGDAEYDLWTNSAKLKAVITDSNAEIRYRKQGDADWTSVPVVAEGDYSYVATVAPAWNEAQSEGGQTVYTLAAGISAGNTYEYQLVVAGVAQGAVKSFTTSTTQVVPYGDMEDSSLSCFGIDNANAPFWGSGNNNYFGIAKLKTLCNPASFAGQGGASCAKLSSTSAVGILAAGNLFTGTFVKPSTQGTVSFGVPFEWQARPKAFRLKYHAALGNVNLTKYADASGNDPIAKGNPDKARIYVAIVDWSARHEVSSGLATPSGMWDPASQNSVAEGAIIGYAGLWIEASTAGDSMVEVELPVYYYDRVPKPQGNYTLVISCSANAYGDYMCGCDSNVMYVDDFEWVY